MWEIFIFLIICERYFWEYNKVYISKNPVLDALGAFVKIEYNINIMLLL